MQMWMAEFKPTSSPPNIYSDYAIHIILRKMMEYSHLWIIIQRKTGKIKIHSALLFIIETLYGTKWGHRSTMCTYLDYESLFFVV